MFDRRESLTCFSKWTITSIKIYNLLFLVREYLLCQYPYHLYTLSMDFHLGSVVKNPPAKQETQGQSLGWDDPLENWCFWTVVLEKTLESKLGCKEIQLVNRKGNQSWIFIRRTEAETPTLWQLDGRNQLIGKDPDAGKDWRQEEKGMTKDEMVAWHLQPNGHEFEQALGVGDGQGSLVCCTPLNCKELDTTERLNRTDWWMIFERN